MADLLTGADSEGYEDFCEEIYNAIKNHFAQSDPRTAVTAPAIGVIAVDTDDFKVYVYTGESGESWREILTARYVVNASLGGVPPTDAILDTLFTSPAEVGNGRHRYVRDTDSGNRMWLIMSTGSSWFYVEMTLAV